MSMTIKVMTPKPVIPEWTFGDRIRKVRRELGLSQGDFAARIGMKQATVASWEAGAAEQPRGAVEAAKAIEREFGIPAAWVLDIGSMATQRYTHSIAA